MEKRVLKYFGIFLIMVLGVPGLVLVLGDSELRSESKEASSEKTQETVWVGADRHEDYLLEPGDNIRIKIYPEDQYFKGGEMDISSEGNVTLPLVGRVHIAGMTPIAAGRALAKVLDANYLVNPEVVVELGKQKESMYTVLVLGQVSQPGTHPFSRGKSFTLLQAISTAGGFSPIANPKKIKIMRRTGGKKNKVIRVNAEAVLSGKDADVELKPGDVIHVAESIF